MRPLILKFGGASVKDPESFHAIANLIAEKRKENVGLVVVVSAMGNTTDELLTLAKKVHPHPPHREQDMLVSVGERISISLLAMALSLKGLDAISFTGSQSGILTNENHTDAKIIDVRPSRIERSLADGQIAIVAGFQGVSRLGEITTLGRGGSDTTAVALSVALGSEKVEFYKDVGGIFEKDPKVDQKARCLPELSYAEALSLAKLGKRAVLHPRSILLAEKNGIKLYVLPGSVIGGAAKRKEEVQYECE